MSTDSLIGKIKDLRKDAEDRQKDSAYSEYWKGTADAYTFIINIMGDASTRKDEGANTTGCTSPASPSEIPVKSLPLDIWEAALDDGTLFKNYDWKEVVYKLIRAARRNPEPVSLAHCSQAIIDLEQRPLRHGPLNSVDYARAVLYAAGVKHVD